MSILFVMNEAHVYKTGAINGEPELAYLLKLFYELQQFYGTVQDTGASVLVVIDWR